ncbi:FMN-binding protein MioC [Psychrobium sp. 1_MG-2023]|uniref:FMN-binding protein MioC n=1 Tax=Psychrobium sp. 1_MG-2023 TaxID=3062624 RepID=UPI000C337788|nr:FMN-binding protein MioC [Psychrobium sp. 1_MG-2023]MDP2560500.1 FMN-binding protein MioC [Psychrobium sp. 1_MG-2023]PKF55196.1 FMN-binding protein MioC [Alteromonadales bacterium alter-6D02]
MSNISILIGTMLGASEYVADHLTSILESEHQVTNYLTPDLNELDLNQPQLWIVCTSTHGAGDFPDSIAPFVEQLTQQKPDLSNIKFAVCALGDSSYDTFCQAGKDIDNLLSELNAQRETNINLIDVSLGELPEDSAEQWLLAWKDQLID